jgi:hypothetical protein
LITLIKKPWFLAAVQRSSAVRLWDLLIPAITRDHGASGDFKSSLVKSSSATSFWVSLF